MAGLDEGETVISRNSDYKKRRENAVYWSLNPKTKGRGGKELSACHTERQELEIP